MKSRWKVTTRIDSYWFNKNITTNDKVTCQVSYFLPIYLTMSKNVLSFTFKSCIQSTALMPLCFCSNWNISTLPSCIKASQWHPPMHMCILIQRQAWCLFMVFNVGSLNYAFSSADLFCPCRKRQHSVHAGSVRLSVVLTELQVSGEPQVQRVLGQHQHWPQPRALAQLGAPHQPRVRLKPPPQPVCLVMLRWPRPCCHRPSSSMRIQHRESCGTISGFFVQVVIKQNGSILVFPHPLPPQLCTICESLHPTSYHLLCHTFSKASVLTS